MIRRPPRSTLFPYTTLFRSQLPGAPLEHRHGAHVQGTLPVRADEVGVVREADRELAGAGDRDRKSTRLNSSHANISYAVFCLKKKNNKARAIRQQTILQLDP